MFLNKKKITWTQSTSWNSTVCNSWYSKACGFVTFIIDNAIIASFFSYTNWITKMLKYKYLVFLANILKIINSRQSRPKSKNPNSEGGNSFNTSLLVVKVRNMNMDFNTGGTWHRVRQWTLMMKIYDFFIRLTFLVALYNNM